AYHFIRKSDRVVEAQTKGKGKATSKDDGIYACCIEAYAEVYSPRPVGVTFRGGNGGKLYQEDVPKADSRNIGPYEEFYRQMLDSGKHSVTELAHKPGAYVPS